MIQFLLLPFLFFSTPSFANFEDTEEVTKNTVTPLGKKFRCVRYFTYLGKDYSCDSVLGHDGQGLREFMADTPKSLELLDTYRINQRRTRYTAYSGTLGILLMLFNPLITKNKQSQKQIRLAGLGLFGGSILVGLSWGKWNERYLDRSIEEFNRGHPDKPIEFTIQKEF